MKLGGGGQARKEKKDQKDRVRAAQARREAGLAKAKVGDERPVEDASEAASERGECFCVCVGISCMCVHDFV